MVMQNAMCLNLNVSPETLVISLRSPFPADSFSEIPAPQRQQKHEQQ